MLLGEEVGIPLFHYWVSLNLDEVEKGIPGMAHIEHLNCPAAVYDAWGCSILLSAFLALSSDLASMPIVVWLM